MNDDARKLHDDARVALHRCWNSAVGTPGYNKTDWQILERQLHRGCPSGCLAQDIWRIA